MDAGKTSCICICTLKYISIADALKNYPARLPPIDEPSGIIGCTTGNSKATRRTHLSPERAVSPHPPAPSSDLLQFSPEHRRRTLLQWYHNLYIGQTYMSCEQLRQISYFERSVCRCNSASRVQQFSPDSHVSDCCRQNHWLTRSICWTSSALSKIRFWSPVQV